jgi:hypothetical protein
VPLLPAARFPSGCIENAFVIICGLCPKQKLFKEEKMNKRLRFVLCVLLALAVGGPAPAAESSPELDHIYVTPDGVSSGGCTETTPCDLRYAVEIRAGAGDIVYVESGTYSDATPGLSELLLIDKDLMLIGSCDFDANVCDSSKRDSILDAGNNKRALTIAGSGVEEVWVWGFTIFNGNADGISTGGCNPDFAPLSGCGGGIHAADLAYLYLRNNLFRSNLAGDVPHPGTDYGLGGGLYGEDIDAIRAEGNIFDVNYAAYRGLGLGGGVFLSHCGTASTELDFHDNVFRYNEVSTTHGGGGAGMYSYKDANLALENNIFVANNATQQQLIEGAGLLVDSSGFSIEGNIFTSNWGYSAFSVQGEDFEGELVWNHFWANDSAENAAIVGHGNLSIYHNFIGFFPGTGRGGSNTSISIHGDGVKTLSVHIWYNSLAMAGTGISIGPNAYVEIKRNILAHHTVEAINTSSSGGTSTWAVFNNLFHDNKANDVPGTHAIYGDPMFVNAAQGDFHLLASSPAIDRVDDGCPRYSQDIDGDMLPWVISNAATPFDLGADEFTYRQYLPLGMK